MFQKRIHVFKAGDQTSAQGVARNFSTSDLEQVVQSYDPSIHEAPLVLGHQGDSDSLPSYGWIKGFERVGDNLYADVEFTDVAKDLVKNGHYRKVSISFYSPDSQINPHPGKWTARHLAMLGAAPPAVKGLEPFNFREWHQKGVLDFTVALDPAKVFDDELGPTLIRDMSPLALLQEKLDQARQSMQEEVQKVMDGQATEAEEEDTTAEVEQQESLASEVENPSNPSNFTERARYGDAARSIADIEDQFPIESSFMEEPGIKRQMRKTKHGQVSQIVEDVYEEGLYEEHEEVSARNPKMRDPRIQPGRVDYKESSRVSDKKNPKPGKVRFGTHPENSDERNGSFGRFQTGKSSEQALDRMDTGKTSQEDASFGRMELSRVDEEQATFSRNRLGRSSEQEDDRLQTGRYVDPDDEGRYDTMSREQMYNNDMYDDDVDYGVNDAELSRGKDPYGRKESETQIPTETEEMPDDTIFATKVENVTRAKNARVMQIKSSDKPATNKYARMRDEVGDGRPAKGIAGSRNYAEPQPAEMVGPDAGAYAERRSRKKDELSGEFEGGPDEVSLKSGGTFSEASRAEGRDYGSYRGEPKSKSKVLTPGAYDDVDEPAEKTGPSGVTGGAEYKESTAERKEAADRAFERKRQRREGDYGKAHETEEIMKMRDKRLSDDHAESDRAKARRDRDAEARRQRSEGRYGAAHETEELEELETSHGEGEYTYKQGYNDRLDESLGDRDGKESGKKQSMKARRDESKGMEKAMGKRAYEHIDHAEDEYDYDEESEVLRQAGIRPSRKTQLSGEFPGGVAQETGPSGVKPGIDTPYAEHDEDDNPYQENGFGSTYAEDEDEEEFCDMGNKKSMGRNYKEPSMKTLREEDGDGFPAKGIPDSDEFSEFYAELQALKEENARIKHEYREAQIARRRDQIHSFVEGLYNSGKMVDSIIPEQKLIEFAEGLEFGVLEFSEGETATDMLFGILDNLPNLVDFSEYAGGSMKFVEEADLDPHQAALKMVEESGGKLDYVEALKKSMFS